MVLYKNVLFSQFMFNIGLSLILVKDFSDKILYLIVFDGLRQGRGGHREVREISPVAWYVLAWSGLAKNLVYKLEISDTGINWNGCIGKQTGVIGLSELTP